MPPKVPEPDNIPIFMKRTQEALDALRAGRIAAQKPDPGPALAAKLRAALELEALALEEDGATPSGDAANYRDTEPPIPFQREDGSAE